MVGRNVITDIQTCLASLLGYLLLPAILSDFALLNWKTTVSFSRNFVCDKVMVKVLSG